MILPSNPPPSESLHGEDQTLPPPPYQEYIPSSQLLPRERLNESLYAPPVSSRFGPSYEREVDPPARLNSLEGKSPRFPEPTIRTGGAYPEPPPLPPKDREKEGFQDGPAQRALGVFSSMVWGAPSAASTSRSPGSSSNISTSQDPLNPAPSAFTRPTPKNYAYLPFKPMTMLGISSNLADGFPIIPPPINPEDEKQVGKANAQHPFVSHDVTEEDWPKFLIDLKTVASSPSQTQKSFLARMFLSEMNERELRKRAIHFVDSWNHYFFQPRRMTVVLARGRKVFNGASGNSLRRRHSAGYERGRGTDPAHKKGHRHRSHSTDSSSSSSSSSSSDSSIQSTTSEPHEMPVPHTQTDHGFEKGAGGLGRGMGRGCGSRGRGFGGASHHGWHGSPGGHGGRGGRGWHSQGSHVVPPAPGVGGGPFGHGGHAQSHHTHHGQKVAWRAEKRAWKVERRAAKHAHRQAKRAMRHERRQRKREARAMRYHGEKSTHKRDQPWKLIISFHGAHRDS